MNKRPVVSVLVPSYNHGQYITERIDSIMAQSFTDIELIVIDDYSKDNSDETISKLQQKFGFIYIRNSRNSGTPFAAWERICELAQGEFIWVCESDDVAEPTFLETALNRFCSNPSAVLFYSNSLVINELSEVVGHTDSYFRDFWREGRWEQDFSANGFDELAKFQLKGQTVPNMSSALIKATAFKKAFKPFLKRLSLTGDWLFVGDVLREGDVEFSHLALSRFRRHKVTARARVQSARSQAEFILTKYHLFRKTALPAKEFAPLMASDVIRFLYEPVRWWEVMKPLLEISFLHTIQFGALLVVSTAKQPALLNKFKQRYKHAKLWKRDST